MTIEYYISWGLNIVGKFCDDVTTQLNNMYGLVKV